MCIWQHSGNRRPAYGDVHGVLTLYKAKGKMIAPVGKYTALHALPSNIGRQSMR